MMVSSSFEELAAKVAACAAKGHVPDDEWIPLGTKAFDDEMILSWSNCPCCGTTRAKEVSK